MWWGGLRDEGPAQSPLPRTGEGLRISALPHAAACLALPHKGGRLHGGKRRHGRADVEDQIFNADPFTYAPRQFVGLAHLFSFSLSLNTGWVYSMRVRRATKLLQREGLPSKSSP